jgi:chromosomal replication initiation ATPase DnaA
LPNEERLSGKRTGHRDERALAMELMYRYGAVGQAEIGKALGGLDYTAVSRERKRLRQRIETDKVLRMALVNIERKLMS